MTISVKVELLPGVRAVGEKRKLEIELRDGATVKELLLAAGFGESDIQHLRVWVRKDLASFHTVLNDSDELLVAVPLSGG
jgi:molybdopterin converting factor small subunit